MWYKDRQAGLHVDSTVEDNADKIGKKADR